MSREQKMANYYGQGRTNTFAVRSIDALKAELSDTDIEVLERADGRVTLFTSSDGDGDFSVYRYDEDGEFIDDEPLFIPDIIAGHLQPGETAVFESSGWEKFRYMSAWAIAVHSDGRQVRVDVNDVYTLAAQEFGIDRTAITDAAY